MISPKQKKILSFPYSSYDAIICDGAVRSGKTSMGKLADASPAQITTAIGTLIDKWAAISGAPGDTAKEDDLSRSLKELAKEMEDGG